MSNDKNIKYSPDYAGISPIQTIIDQMMNCICKRKTYFNKITFLKKKLIHFMKIYSYIYFNIP